MEVGLAFGRVLRRLRRQRGLTQETLAFEAEIQRNYVSLMELGRNQPSISVVFKLARALGHSPAHMIMLVERELRG